MRRPELFGAVAGVSVFVLVVVASELFHVSFNGHKPVRYWVASIAMAVIAYAITRHWLAPTLVATGAALIMTMDSPATGGEAISTLLLLLSLLGSTVCFLLAFVLTVRALARRFRRSRQLH